MRNPQYDELKVVLVDDDRHTRNIFELTLNSEPGVSLVSMESAEEGFEYLESHTADVVVLDIILPGVDGYQALSQMRQIPGLERTAFVATTTFYAQDTEHVIRIAGFDGYLPKPLNPVELVPYLRETVEAKGR